ncbi:MAG TPA: PQQ-binding-like beta-propeller repeat protein [Bryobacteraceae bacterium]|nr:PQQ-binding-like beta-propeller repeat protein [Bryobacteraceae bacterium]
MKKHLLLLLAITFAAHAQSNNMGAGARSFAIRCSVCHGGDGNGNERAPAIIGFVASNSDDQIAALIRKGVGAMPPHTIADAEMKPLVAFLHTLRRQPGFVRQQRMQTGSAKMADGRTLQGTIWNETNFDMQLQTADGKMHLLVRDGNVYTEPSLLPKRDWPSYDGGFSGNRYSPLDQINTANVKHLTLKWMFPIPGAPRLEATPVVSDGIMYVTAVNQADALDATTGRRIWEYSRPRTPNLLGEAAGGANRGVALTADKVFMLTDDAHLIALDRGNGKLSWDVEMADHIHEQYSATGAPFVIGDLVIAGVAGGEEGTRGFIDAYQASTGKRAWRFWTIPKPGEKGSETWIGSALEHGCGATWMSGSYDPDLDLLYWATGNPCPDFNGDDRKGDNLYTSSVLAINPKTGELKWYFQCTPHDTHDWDADEPLILTDEMWHGKPRKLLVQANRNGFFYVLDRTNGELLLATPFVKKVTWASGYDKQGKVVLLPNSEPTTQGTLTCPGSATNWMSASYNPVVKLFFVSATDSCGITRKIPAPYQLGQRFFNGTMSGAQNDGRFIRALDIQTGRKVWDYAQTPGGRSASGTLSTAGGLVFFGEDSGVFTSLDAKTGLPLWHFSASQSWRASPMTYMVGGKQYVAIAGPAGFMVFGLAE